MTNRSKSTQPRKTNYEKEKLHTHIP